MIMRLDLHSFKLLYHTFESYRVFKKLIKRKSNIWKKDLSHTVRVCSNYMYPFPQTRPCIDIRVAHLLWPMC